VAAIHVAGVRGDPRGAVQCSTAGQVTNDNMAHEHCMLDT